MSDDSFPNDDFFLDVNNIFGDMGENVNTNAQGSTYVILSFLFEILL
jgi:hypothetical protein